MTRLSTGVSGVDSGPGQHNIRGVGGSFTLGAAATTTVADADVLSGSNVIWAPGNAAAGLLVNGKTCWIDTIAAGSFVFNISASGAGAPAGTELIRYIVT